MARLILTALGIDFSGFFASSPKAVAHSNPTREKIATTTPSPTLDQGSAETLNCGVSIAKWCCARTMQQSSTISAIETPSQTSIIIADNCTFFQAQNQAMLTQTADKTYGEA